MEIDEIKSQLNRLADSGENVDALADSMVIEARTNIESLIQLWKASSPASSKAYAFALAESLGILSVPTLLHHLEADTGTHNHIQLITTISRLCRSTDERFIELLMSLLDDKRMLPEISDDPAVEEPYPALRVCDEAYNLLKKLCRSGSNYEEALIADDDFISLDEGDRDSLIEIAHDRNRWRELF